MDVQNLIWLYIFIACVAILLFYYIKNFMKLKVDIRKRVRNGSALQYVGYLEMDNDGSAGEVKLPGGGSLPSVGRIIVDKQAGRENGFVEVVATDIQDETTPPKYKQMGYICFNDGCIIDKYGYVYHQERGNKKRVMVGYCARPSAPNTPTIYGERTWRSLWLECTLNFYAGMPDIENNEEQQSEQTPATKLVGIGSPRDEQSSSEDAGEHTPSVEEEQLNSTIADTTEKTSSNETAQQPTEDTPKEEGKFVEEGDKKKKEKKKKNKKQPYATASFIGFHSSSRDYLPAEARACAFAALVGDVKRGQYSEFFKTQPYGWKDTALLSTLIYCALFYILYFVYEVVLDRQMFGNDVYAIAILSLLYFVLWAIVRLVKIDYIERSNSFQKSLDLLNKNVGLKGFNFTILVLAALSYCFTIGDGNFDFLPLIWAIAIGLITNMSLKGANKKWTISTSYNEEMDDVEDEDDEIRNPEGDIACEYTWDLDPTYSSQQLRGNLTLYFTSQEISDMRQCNPFFAQRKEKKDKEYIIDMFHFLQEHKHFTLRVRYIAKYINDIIKKNSLTPLDKIQFTLDFVQEPNIRFVSNKDCNNIGNYENYIRYPDETLYDKEGDSNSKSLLAAMLFNAMGHNVMYLASRKFKYGAVAIEIKASDVEACWYGSNIDEMFIRENGKYYLFCETTGDRFKIGKTINGITINDFEDRALLEVETGAPTLDEPYAKSVIFNWDLDSAYGNNLHGNIILKFNEDKINTLREHNPFITYGYDANTYDTNIKNMFDFLRKDEQSSLNITTIAEYIRHEVENAKLPELDLIQFALNFVQTPNIVYRIDEECASIDFKKEYMRFPDETLYDKEGDCDCKSFLAACILHKLGYNVIFLLSKKLNHAGIAVECKHDWFDVIGRDNYEQIVLEYQGKQYVYCESTGSGNRVGNIKEGDSIKDFETIVELSV